MGWRAAFFRYTRKHMPEVYAALVEALSDEAHRDRVVELALGMDSISLDWFLRCARTDLPTVYPALVKALSERG